MNPCPACGRGDFGQTANLAVVLLWVPGKDRPLALFTDDLLKCCLNPKCKSAWCLADKIQDSHPGVRYSQRWTRALLVFDDGKGADIPRSAHPSPGPAMGVA